MNVELPKDWKLLKLVDIAKFIDYRGRTPKKTESGIPLITAKNVKMGFISETPREYIATTDYKSWMTRGFPINGDVLFTTEAPLGNVAQLKTNDKIALAQRIITFQCYELVFNSFLKYNLLSPQFQKNLQSKGTGTTVKGIKAAILKKIEIPIPPLPEQHRIVAKIEELFSDLDNGIENLKTAQQQLKTYRQAVLKYAFEGRFTNKVKSEKGKLPEGWRWAKLNEIGKWSGGGTPTKQNKSFWEKGNVLWVSPKDMKRMIISDSIDKITKDSISHSAAKLIKKDSIMFVVRSGILRRTLPIAIAGKDLTTNQDLQSLTLYSEYCQYVYWYCMAYEQAIREKCVKDGTTVDNIEVPRLKEYPIIICPLEEQHRIVEEIESRLSVCDKVEETITASLQQSESLRQSILKKAFEGKLI